MFRLILSAAVLLFTSSPVLATELTNENLVGRYKITTSEGPMKIYLNFNVLDGSTFEIQRVYEDGSTNEVCDGPYKLTERIYEDVGVIAVGKVFQGVFSCPSSRSWKVNLTIDFKNATLEDLQNGTTVNMTSSSHKHPFINAHIQKQ